FAMSTRRREMSIKTFRDKASGQIIEINRKREELKRLAAERDAKNQSPSELEAKAGELRGELRQREDQLQRLGGRQGDAEKVRRAAELGGRARTLRRLLAGAKGGDVEKAGARLIEARDRLEAGLTAMIREYK